MRHYEIMLILPADVEESTVGETVEKIGHVLGDQGKVGKVDAWGRRRLAYEIDKQSEGFYLIVEFEADPAAIKELDRTLSLADQIVRFKVVAKAAA